MTTATVQKMRVLDLNKINKGVTAKQAGQAADSLGVEFVKAGTFRKWISAEVGTKLGSYTYTHPFIYNGKCVVLCFCKLNGTEAGSLGLVRVAGDVDISAANGYHYIADYLV